MKPLQIRSRANHMKTAVAGEACIGQAPRTGIQVPQLSEHCHISHIVLYEGRRAPESHHIQYERLQGSEKDHFFQEATESKVAAQTYSWLQSMKVACSSRSKPCRRPMPSCAATTDTTNPVTTKLPIAASLKSFLLEPRRLLKSTIQIPNPS
jgi:hypothetical protein